MKEILPGIFMQEERFRKKIYTRNLVPGKKAHKENLFEHNGVEYREWTPLRSKLAAGILKGIKVPPIREGSVVLYLGASTGNTVSFVSDILGPEGMVFAVEFAPRMMRNLIYLSQVRPNISPILADAGKPERYFPSVVQADLVFQDIAQRNQVDIFVKNVKLFLKPGGYAILALKARSVDMAQEPRAVYAAAKLELQKSLVVLEAAQLDPFEKDHAMFLCQLKK